MSMHIDIRDMLPLTSLRGTPEGRVSIKDEHDIYNPYKVPADLDLAQKHAKAKQIYESKPNEIPLDNDMCPCCGLPVEGTRIPINCDLSSMYHLGSGYALYFEFVKHCINLLLIMLVISGIYNLYTNYISGDCGNEPTTSGMQYCYEDYVTRFTIANKRNQHGLLSVQIVLNVFTIIAIAVYFHYIRYTTRKTHIAADDQTVTPSDYTLQLKGVPKEECTEEEIAEWLESQAEEGHPIKVVKVLRTYEISKYVRDLRTKQELLEKRSNPDLEDAKLEVINKKLEEVDNRLAEAKKQGLKHTDIAFAVFVQATQADFLAKKFEKSRFEKLLEITKVIRTARHHFKGKKVLMRRAPEPTDILWENLGSSGLEKLAKRIFVGLVTLLLVTGGFVFIVAISWAQILIIGETGETSITLDLLNIMISIVVTAMDPIIGITVGKLVSHQKFSTCTAYYTAVAQLLSVSQFLNTAFTTLFAKIVISMQFNPQYNLLADIQVTNFYGIGGLIQSTFFVFITNSFVNPITTIFDPPYVLKQYLMKKALEEGKENNLTQQEAQELFEGQDFGIDWRYGYMVETMLFVSFYAPAMPICIIMTLVGLVISYWIEKYVLLTRVVLPNSLSSQLQESMIEHLEWIGFMYALGNLIFQVNLEDFHGGKIVEATSIYVIFLSLVFSLVHIFFPMQLLNEKLFPLIDEVTEFQDYDDARLTFLSDYDIANPITCRKAIKDLLLAFVKKKEKEELAQEEAEEPAPAPFGGLLGGLLGQQEKKDTDAKKSRDAKSLLIKNRKSKGPSQEVLQVYYKALLGKLGDTEDDNNNPFTQLDKYSKEMMKPSEIKRKLRKLNFTGVAAQVNRNFAEGFGAMLLHMVGGADEDNMKSHKNSEMKSSKPSFLGGLGGGLQSYKGSRNASKSGLGAGGFFLNLLANADATPENKDKDKEKEQEKEKDKKMSTKVKDIEIPLLGKES